MPLSGKIIAINSNLADSPELVNTSPYGFGWILKIEYTDKLEIDDLLLVEDYKRIVETEN